MASLVNCFVREYATPEHDVAEVIYSEKKMWYAEKGEGWKSKQITTEEPDEVVELSEQEKEEKRVESLACSIRRSKKMLKFLVLNNVLSNWRFMTLTYEGTGCFERKQFARDIENMIRRLEKHLNKDVNYICAYEFHPGGHGYHAHLLIDVNYYKNEVFQRLFWQKGFVHLEKVKFRKSPKCILKAAKYMMKYVSKDAEKTEKGSKRYSASRNLITEPYKVAYNVSGVTAVKDVVGRLIKRGYKYVEDYSMVLDGELVRCAFYYKALPIDKSVQKAERVCNMLQNMFLGELVA